MRAKYEGICRECGAQIEPGDEIRWSKVDGAQCVECDYDQEAAAEATYFDRIENAAEYRGFYDNPAEDALNAEEARLGF